MQDDARSVRTPLLAAVIFELALAVVAIVVGWLVQINPCPSFSWESTAAAAKELGLGILAAVPPLGFFFLFHGSSARPMVRIRRWIHQALLPLFENASIGDLAVLSLAAGLGEEILFRGFLQNWLHQTLGTSWIAVGLAALAFGLVHAITLAYVVLATAIGIYLGALMVWTESLWVPILAHAVYDFVALWYLAHSGPPSVGNSDDPREDGGEDSET